MNTLAQSVPRNRVDKVSGEVLHRVLYVILFVFGYTCAQVFGRDRFVIFLGTSAFGMISVSPTTSGVFQSNVVILNNVIYINFISLAML